MTIRNKSAAALICLAALLLAGAAASGAYLWYRGARAEQDALSLLEELNRPVQGIEAARISTLQLPALELELPVVWEYSEEALESAVCRYQGPDPGGEGNLVLTGHDYLSGAVFGRLHRLKVGDEVSLFDDQGVRHKYTVYDNVTVLPDDVAALEDYRRPHTLTLLTCADNANKRLLIRCTPAQSEDNPALV